MSIFDNIPTDCLILIFVYLPKRDLFHSIAFVRKEFYEILETSEVIFQKLCFEEYKEKKLDYFEGFSLENNKRICISEEDEWKSRFKRLLDIIPKSRIWNDDLGDFGCWSNWKLTIHRNNSAELYGEMKWKGMAKKVFLFRFRAKSLPNGYVLTGKEINELEHLNKRDKCEDESLFLDGDSDDSESSDTDKTEKEVSKVKVKDIEICLELLKEEMRIYSEFSQHKFQYCYYVTTRSLLGDYCCKKTGGWFNSILKISKNASAFSFKEFPMILEGNSFRYPKKQYITSVISQSDSEEDDSSDSKEEV